MCRECLQHRVQLLRVQTAQLAESGIIVSVLHEKRQRQLLGLRTGLRVFVFDLPEDLRHFFGQYHVRNLDRRKQRGREGAEVNDALMMIQPLQRRDRFSEIAQLAVIIVLDDQALISNRPVDQLVPSADRHHRARRKLIRRTGVNC